MKKTTIFLLTIGTLLLSCTSPYKPLHDATIRHASLLQMENLPEQRTLCRILNPWAPQQIAMQYLLVERNDTLFSSADSIQIAEQYGSFQLLRTPLQRQALTASCHAWLLGQLKALDKVAVMCDANYVIDSTMLQLLATGEVADGGSSMAPNSEVLISTHCDAIWISPYEATSLYNNNQRFQIPVIYCADYMEFSPLGRAEWMRFFGRLVGCVEQADSLFSEIEANYHRIASQADTLATQHTAPTLLCELPYSGTWYVAGGCSTLGLMYQDAGFNYPWSRDSHAGSLALSPEAVFSKAQQADIWIFKYYAPDTDLTLSQLTTQNVFFPQIKAVQEGMVLGCNTSRSNYFDVTPFRPDWLLEELSQIAQNHTDSLRFFHLIPTK